MKINTIIKLISTLLIALTLSACGGGGGSSSTVAIEVTDCDTYTIIEDGDELVRDEADTEIRILDQDGTKKVCVVSGSAHLNR